MIKTLKFMSVALCATVAFGGFTSCSDDDNGPATPGTTIEEVFPEGVPAQVGDSKIVKNAEGQVTKIQNDYETVEFEYGIFTRADNYQVKMTVTEKDYPEDGFVIYMQLNSDGFVSHALQVYNDGDEDTWDFGYNKDGQLNYLRRTDNDEDLFEITEMTYSAGNIVKVKEYETNKNGELDGDEGSSYTIEYATSTSALIANKGAIMLFDDLFNIDMDEMGIAYYAGLLGKATKNLPILLKSDHSDYTYTYNWTIDANGFPTKLETIYTDSYGTYPEGTEYFKW